jgi:hypothetical protein
MADTETAYDPNSKSNYTRETKDAGDVAKGTATYDPRTSAASQGEGAPKRAQFDDGLPGDAAYAKALRRYQKLKAEGQTKAFGEIDKAKKED